MAGIDPIETKNTVTSTLDRAEEISAARNGVPLLPLGQTVTQELVKSLCEELR